MRRANISTLLIVLIAGGHFARAQAIQLITDQNFARGFEVQAPNQPPTIEGNLQWDTSAGPPVWTLSQWSSQSTIFGTTPTNTASGAFRYANADKEIIAGGGPSATESDLVLSVNAFNEYGGQFRQPGESWPHLLVSQRISDPGGFIGSQSPSIADMSSLDFNIDARLLYDNKTTTAGYDPNIHAAQYNIFYTVQNLNTSSPGFGDFLWFGTALYDDRDDVTGFGTLIDASSQKLIYGIGIEPFTSEHIADGNWLSVGGDLLPHMKAALNTAWGQGLLLDSQDYADYRIGGVNLGWEIPGLNDASMQIRNYSVVANLGSSQFQTFEDDATTQGLWHMNAVDNLNPGGGLQDFVEDDRTFGAPDRPAGRSLLLGLPGASEHPTFLPAGGPDGSGALDFDGVDDVARALGAWGNPSDSISIDFQMRPDSLPDFNGDNFMGLVGVLPFQLYLQDDGNGTGMVTALAFHDDSVGGSTIISSQPGLALDQWHEVHAEVTNTGGNGSGRLTITIDGETYAVDMLHPLGPQTSQAVLGRQVTDVVRYFDGALDEVRIATAPSASTVTPGDFDEDGDVDGADFLLWQQGFGTTYNSNHLTNWQNNFGFSAATSAAPATAVPEPSSFVLMLLLGIGQVNQDNSRRRASHKKRVGLNCSKK